MIDLYLVNTIINAIWYIFTILFLLYRFTSFFSYIYNFVRFCGKIVSGGIYVCDYIYGSITTPRYQYSDIESQSGLLEIQPPPTVYQRTKRYINKTYNKFFGKSSNFVFNNNNGNPQIRNNGNTNIRDFNNIKQMEKDMFDKQLNDLCESEISRESQEKRNSLNNSFIDQQMFNSNKNSKSDCLYCHESYELKNLRRDFGTSTEELNSNESNYFSYRSKNLLDQSHSLDNFDNLGNIDQPFNTGSLYPPPPFNTSNSSNLYQSINLENSANEQSTTLNISKRKISNSSMNEKIKLCKLNENQENELSSSEYFDTGCNDSDESNQSNTDSEPDENPYV